MKVAIVDYGAGNLRSVAKAVEHCGHSPAIASKPAQLRKADVIVLPGVGSAAFAMERLKAQGLVEPLRQAIAEDRPFLGICLGLQLLFQRSEEGDTSCLGVLPGTVRRLPTGRKVPHMGWNSVRLMGQPPFFQGIPQDAQFYFVHSYYPEPEDRSIVIGETEYGVTICSAVARGRLVATQFHPEKSSTLGLKLYENFFRMASEQTIETG